MHTISNLYGAFSIEFDLNGEKCLIRVIPEMAPARVGLKALGSYFIYCVHPERGSMTFIIAQDEKDGRMCERLPSFIEPGLIAWIGKKIEKRGEI